MLSVGGMSLYRCQRWHEAAYIKGNVRPTARWVGRTTFYLSAMLSVGGMSLYRCQRWHEAAYIKGNVRPTARWVGRTTFYLSAMLSVGGMSLYRCQRWHEAAYIKGDVRPTAPIGRADNALPVRHGVQASTGPTETSWRFFMHNAGKHGQSARHYDTNWDTHRDAHYRD